MVGVTAVDAILVTSFTQERNADVSYFGFFGEMYDGQLNSCSKYSLISLKRTYFVI